MLCNPHLCVLLLPLVLISNSLGDVLVRHAISSCEGLLSGWSRQWQSRGSTEEDLRTFARKLRDVCNLWVYRLGFLLCCKRHRLHVER